MRLKKILAGVVSGALAATTFASVATITSSAADTTKTLWESSTPFELNVVKGQTSAGNDYVKTFDNTMVICDGVGGDGETAGSKGVQAPAYWKEGSKLIVHFKQTEPSYKSKTAKTANLDTAFQVVGKLGDAWAWTALVSAAHLGQNTAGEWFVVDDLYEPDEIDDPADLADAEIPGFSVDMSNPEDGKLIVDMSTAYECEDDDSYSYYTAIREMKELCIKGQDAVITSVEITGDYNAPVFDQWVDNGDGTYTYVSSKPNGDPGESADFKLTKEILPISDYSDVKSVSVDITHNDWATLSLGGNNGNNAWEKEEVALNGTPSTETLTFEPLNGLADGVEPLVQCSFMNANTELTISNFKVEYNHPVESSSDAEVSSEVESSSVAEASSEVEASSAVESSSDSEASSDADSTADSSSVTDESVDPNAKYSFEVQAGKGGQAGFTKSGEVVEQLELTPDEGTKVRDAKIDATLLDANWQGNGTTLVKRIIRGGAQDGAIYTDNSGDEVLKSIRSITMTITGAKGEDGKYTKAHTTGSIVYSVNGGWEQLIWKVNVSGDNDDGITVQQVGNDFVITATYEEPLITDEDLAVKDPCFAIAFQNYGDSDKKTGPGYAIKSVVAKDADGNVVYSDGQTSEEDGLYAAGTKFTCTATPNEGYAFVNWTDANGNEVSKEAEFEYTLGTANTVLTANFVDTNADSNADSKVDSADSDADADDSDKTSDTDASSNADSNADNNGSANNAGNNNNGGSANNGGSTTGGSTSGGSSTGSNDASTNTGVSALALVGVALAGVAVVVTKKKK